ncbi:hypothetical protein [Escherichia coli]|uniref:hypothetical protein n=1 Tax=Escherichia coli TaxID=562 RepID=UPI001F47D286|nr:hypothetical protein [Escherichia coli]
MSEKAGTKGAKAAKNSAAQENPAPLADVIVADGQANEPRPLKTRLLYRVTPCPAERPAVSENGFWRCGRFWSHAGEDVAVTAAVATRLMAEPNLIVRETEKG